MFSISKRNVITHSKSIIGVKVNMTTKIFLIEHENSFLGYQAFKEVSCKMQFICDLKFLEPLEIIETYDEENETLILNYYIPLLTALERSSIEFEIKDKHTFIIAEEDLDKLLKYLHKVKVSKLKRTATEYREKAESYIEKAEECEREISEMII